MIEPHASNEQTLIIKRQYPNTPEVIFKAWTTPELLSRWFSPSEEVSTPLVEVDLKVGGSYRIGFQIPNGTMAIVGGVYCEITPPNKLAFTWQWEEPHEFSEIQTLVTVEFTKIDEGTEVVLTQEGLTSQEMREKHSKGWTGCTNRLNQIIE